MLEDPAKGSRNPNYLAMLSLVVAVLAIVTIATARTLDVFVDRCQVGGMIGIGGLVLGIGALRRANVIRNGMRTAVAGIILGGLAGLGYLAFPTSQAKQKQKLSLTQFNVTELSYAMRLYLADFDDRFPPQMQQAASLRSVLWFHISDGELDTYIPSGGEIVGNDALNGLASESLFHPEMIPVLHETRAWPNGEMVVGFADLRPAIRESKPLLDHQLSEKVQTGE